MKPTMFVAAPLAACSIGLALLAGVGPAAATSSDLNNNESVAPSACHVLSGSATFTARRMQALRGGRTSYTDARDLEVAPNLWSGVGLVRGGAGTALVGSHDEVADRLEEYHRIGIDEVILSGEVPSPINPPDGCRFHPRCPHAIARCGVEVPALREIAGRTLACHLADAPAAVAKAPELAMVRSA